MLMMAAVAAALFERAGAFTGAGGARWVHGGREVGVARHVMSKCFSTVNFKQELTTMSNDELHAVITEARKQGFLFRLDKFRKKKPAKERKYEWEYKVAFAKTLLRQREIDESVPAEDPEANMVYRDVIAKDFNSETARKSWAFPSEQTGTKQFPPSRVAGTTKMRWIKTFVEEEEKKPSVGRGYTGASAPRPGRAVRTTGATAKQEEGATASLFSAGLPCAFAAAALFAGASRSRRWGLGWRGGRRATGCS